MRSAVSLILLCTCLSFGNGGRIEPSFSLEHCAWNATDIVLAAEEAEPGPSFTVVETWRGALRTGEPIVVPELPPARSLLVSGPRKDLGRGVPASISGSRVVLYLNRKVEPDRPGHTLWTGAIRGGPRVSTAWIDGDQAYVLMQIVNPGPAELVSLGKTEAQLKKETLAILGVKEELARVMDLPDPAVRAARLLSMATITYRVVRQETVRGLGGCGEHALLGLHALLRSLDFDQREIVRAIAQASGDEAGRNLTAILNDELAFWRELTPALRRGWWNEVDGDRSRLTRLGRARYLLLFESLLILRKLNDGHSREIVRQVREFWASQSQLNEPDGFDQIVTMCDELLEGIPNHTTP